MIVDVILAEAVIPLAAGTVAEFQVGVIRIGAAADGAFVVIQLLRLLLADTTGFSSEIHRVFCRPPASDAPQKLSPAEDEKVQRRNNGQKVARKCPCLL